MSSGLENFLLIASKGTLLEDDVREYMRQNFTSIVSYGEIRESIKSGILNMIVKIIYLLALLVIIFYIGFLIARESIRLGEEIFKEPTDLALLITLSPLYIYILLMIRNVITIILYILVLLYNLLYAIVNAII